MMAAAGANRDELAQRRQRAVKTAWALAVVAFLIFLAFVMSGVLGSAQ